MEIQVSRRTLRRLRRVLIGFGLGLALTVGLYGLGLSVSPRTERGRPVLYSPAVRAAVQYQRRVAGWLQELSQISDTLERLLTETGTDLYTQNTQAEAVLGQTLQIAQAVAVQSAPAALSTVARQMTDISLAHYQAAQAVAAFVAAPADDQFAQAAQAVAQARRLADALAANRWLQEGTWAQ